MTSFREVVFTPSFIPRILHVWVASWMVGAALVLSVSAWYLLKKRHVGAGEVRRSRWRCPSSSFSASCRCSSSAREQAIEVTNYQPLKLAAMEGLWQTPILRAVVLVGWVDEADPDHDGHQHSLPAQLPELRQIRGHGDRAWTRSRPTSGRRSTWSSRSTT